MRWRSRSEGFTLVELAVSSFLVAVGLLAVFALIRRGIDTGEFSEEEIRETLFAESAIATLRATAEHASATGTWTDFWEAFAGDTTSTNLPLPGAFSDIDAPSSENTPAPWLAGNEEWNAALFSGWLREDGSCAVSNTVWYRSIVQDLESYAQVQIHHRANRPRETSRTTFLIIPNETGRAFLRSETTAEETSEGRVEYGD